MQGLTQLPTIRALVAAMLVSALLSACSQSVPVPNVASRDAATSGSSTSTTVPTSDASPVLQGSPATSVVAGTPYEFQPVVTQSSSAVTFAISGAPGWASFDPGTGMLSGTPALSNVGTTGNITITATNDTGVASIGPFTITVTAPTPTDNGSATLSWMAPALNTNGTQLLDLAGYHVYFGTSATQLSLLATLNGTATTTVVNGLGAGTYYFAVTAFNSQGIESAPSNVASKTF